MKEKTTVTGKVKKITSLAMNNDKILGNNLTIYEVVSSNATKHEYTRKFSSLELYKKLAVGMVPPLL